MESTPPLPESRDTARLSPTSGRFTGAVNSRFEYEYPSTHAAPYVSTDDVRHHCNVTGRRIGLPAGRRVRRPQWASHEVSNSDRTSPAHRIDGGLTLD